MVHYNGHDIQEFGFRNQIVDPDVWWDNAAYIGQILFIGHITGIEHSLLNGVRDVLSTINYRITAK